MDGLVQECSISIANALEILQSCTKPSIYQIHLWSSHCPHRDHGVWGLLSDWAIFHFLRDYEFCVMFQWFPDWSDFYHSHFNTLRPKQTYRLFAEDIFKCIFLNKNVWISLKILLKFAPAVWINDIPALVQIMAWRWPGDNPLSEPMMDNLLMHHLASVSYVM